MYKLYLTNEKKRNVEQIYNLYIGKMYGIAFNILKDQYLAEDTVQIAFEKIMKNMEKIDEIDSHRTKAFILVITKNTALTMYMKRKNDFESQLFDNQAALSADPDALEEFDVNRELANRQIDENLKTVLLKLPERDRQIIFLKYGEGLADDVIADVLGIKLKAAQMRIYRAKQRIAKIIEKEGDNKTKKKEGMRG